ncbi:MAG: hypothetical protein WC655_17515, partial [Candidatus Hydrogenedentales bacterium]
MSFYARRISGICVTFLTLTLLLPYAHAATVTWDGGGDGSTWASAANWSTNALPTSADDVIVNDGGGLITITAAASVSVKSIQCEENLNFTSGSLSVTGPSVINGSLTAATGCTITVTGATASLQVNGAASISGANLYANSGGQLLLPSAAANYEAPYSSGRYIQSQGAGSRIDLSSLPMLVGPAFSADYVIKVSATSGGVIDLSSATEVRNYVTISATGTGSQVDLSTMTEIDGSDGFVSATIRDHGSILLPKLATVICAGFYVYDGLTFDLSSVTSFTCTQYDQGVLLAQGTGSKIDLSNLSTIVGPTEDNYFFIITATFGGVVDLSSVGEILNQLKISATGVSSQVDLSGMTEINGGDVFVTIKDHGSVLLTNLAAVSHAAFYAYDGLTLNMPNLVSLTGGAYEDNTVCASGSGSRIEMPKLTTVVGPTATAAYQTRIQALSGGYVSIPTLSTIAGGHVTIQANGVSSVVSLPTLTTWYGNSSASMTANSGGTVRLNPLQTSVTSLPVTLSTLGLSVGTIEVGTLSLDSASTLAGVGAIVGDLVVNGQAYPGGNATFGGLTIDGDCTFSSTGKLNVDIGGVAPAFQYDQLSVTGTATFGGTLALYWRNSFVPAQSDKFDLVFWGARSGEFASVTGAVPAAGHTMRSVYRPNRLVIGELAGLISPAVPAISTPRNVATSYNLTPHNEFAAQPSWSISPSETSLYTATIDANSVLTITPKT